MSLSKLHYRLGFLTAGLMLSVSLMPVSGWAQDGGEDQGLADFSLDLDNLPPQPAQVEPTDDVVIFDVSPATAPTPTAEAQPPADALTPMVSPSTETAVDTTDVQSPIAPHSGQYYDADAIVPPSSAEGRISPHSVDPKYEPGSSFVVVTKGAGAGSREAQIIAAQRALKLGRYTSALEIYEQLYKQAPKNKQILMGLAVAQQSSGFNESAIATYEELLKLDPTNTDATVNMLGLLQKQYPAVAYRKLQELWNKNSQNPGIAAQLGLTSAAIGDAQSAMRYLGIAASMEPQNASHVYNMAIVSDQAGAYKDAIDLYQKALETDSAYSGGRTVPRDQVYDRLSYLRRL